MTDDTATLVLGPLRGIPADVMVPKDDASAIRERLDGWRYVLVATIGSLVTDPKTQESRIAKLEGTHA